MRWHSKVKTQIHTVLPRLDLDGALTLRFVFSFVEVSLGHHIRFSGFETCAGKPERSEFPDVKRRQNPVGIAGRACPQDCL
jgi:hypothetical protein